MGHYANFLNEKISEEMTRNIIEYTTAVVAACGLRIIKAILYGSYARGDYKGDSDIDIMCLVETDDSNIGYLRHQISDLTYDFNTDRDINIKPVLVQNQTFRKWVDSYPFYQTVYNEGIVLYKHD